MDPRSEFKEPSQRFRPMALWFWNGKLSEDEVRRQVVEFGKGGLGGFFMHARSGHNTEYLSDRWMDLVAAAAEAARGSGLEVWIYDEDGWPSGSAGGRVTAGRSDHRAWKLSITRADAMPPTPPPTPGRVPQPLASSPGGEPGGQDGEVDLIAAFEVKMACERPDNRTVVEKLYDCRLVEPRTLQGTCDEHGVERFLLCTASTDGYVDLLNPDVTKRFLDVTHSRYESRCGREFGHLIKGVFSDEPQIPQWAGSLEPVFPWTPKMPELFRKKHGYELIPVLPLLAYDSIDYASTVRVRCDYWQLVSELLAQGFYKQIHDCCEAAGLLFTGHAMDEEDLFGHVRMQGDLMLNLGLMHVPGVDHLFDRTDQSYLIEGAACSYRVTEGTIHIKHASSAAHLNRRERCLVECFGGAGWELGPSQMKRIVNWLAAMGANFFAPHAYYYSIEGRRKLDWPPSHFFQSTFWKYHKHLADYMGRLSSLMTGGIHVAPVAVLYPIASMWANYRGPADRDGAAGRIDGSYRELCSGLSRLGFDYDVVTERDLQQARRDGGGIRMADETYKVLVLPLMDVLSAQSVRSILELLACGSEGLRGGARLMAVGGLPDIGPDGRTDEAHGCLRRIVEGDDAHESTLLLPELGWDTIALTLRSWTNPELVVEGTWHDSSASDDPGDQGTKHHGLCGSAFPALPYASKGLLPDGIYSCHRRRGEEDIFFLANDTDRCFSGTASLPTAGRVEVWDPESGEMVEIQGQVTPGGFTELTVELGPLGATALVVQRPDGSHSLDQVGRSSAGCDIPSAACHAEPSPSLTADLSATADRSADGLLQHDERFPLHHHPAWFRSDEPTVVELPNRWSFRATTPNQLPLLHWEARPELNEDGLSLGWHVPCGKGLVDRRAPMGGDQNGLPRTDPGCWARRDWLGRRDGWRLVTIDMGPPPPELFSDLLKGVPVRGVHQALWYRTCFRIRGDLPGPVLLRPGVIRGNHSLFVNGVPLPVRGSPNEPGGAKDRVSGKDLDQTRCVDVALGDLLVQGLNLVALRIEGPAKANSDAMMDYSDIAWGIVEPPSLVGPFEVWADQDGLRSLVPSQGSIDMGNWADQGYRYYSGTASYTLDWELDPDLAGHAGRNRVYLDVGSVREAAEVRVNGVDCGLRLWPPYVYDVGSRIRAGVNLIEVLVTNGPANALLPPEVKYKRFVPHLYGQREFWYREAEPVRSGLFGPVRLLVGKNSSK
ncbi:MAG: hypothetical protein HYY08_03820 [Firmicutes bacterium]|nr:hypothetical protein [Bacillota bacterium]